VAVNKDQGFLLAVLLRDGERFVEWLIDVAPMSNAVCTRLFGRIDRTARGVLVGVFGGVYAVGAVGLFVGPIVLAVLVATITAFDEEYDALADGTGA